jgi:hypothetical protein
MKLVEAQIRRKGGTMKFQVVESTKRFRHNGPDIYTYILQSLENKEITITLTGETENLWKEYGFKQDHDLGDIITLKEE